MVQGKKERGMHPTRSQVETNKTMVVKVVTHAEQWW
jgi:hypothetical protein